MVEKVYCDTCIFRDFLEGRSDYLRPLDEFANNFFSAVIDSEYIMVYSDHVLFEFGKYLPLDRLTEFIKSLGDSVEFIKVLPSDQKEANTYANYADALHAVVAIRANAKMLTTRNVSDFEDFEDKIQIVLPESL